MVIIIIIMSMIVFRMGDSFRSAAWDSQLDNMLDDLQQVMSMVMMMVMMRRRRRIIRELYCYALRVCRLDTGDDNDVDDDDEEEELIFIAMLSECADWALRLIADHEWPHEWALFA